MASFTVSIPSELKADMDALSEINWPEYFKKQFAVKLTELQRTKKKTKRRGRV